MASSTQAFGRERKLGRPYSSREEGGGCHISKGQADIDDGDECVDKMRMGEKYLGRNLPVHGKNIGEVRQANRNANARP